MTLKDTIAHCLHVTKAYRAPSRRYADCSDISNTVVV